MTSRITNNLRKLLSFAARGLAKRYLQKDRPYTYKKFRLIVFRDVFHPGMFRSTKVFAEWLEQQDVSNKRILEIGSGSGLLSLVAAGKGATVTAVDVNPKAVQNTLLNAETNQLKIVVLHSNLFDAVKNEQFDIILINPPYYPKNPANDYEKAWYCGEGFEYFRDLFQQLEQRDDAGRCYMILSDTCDLGSIGSFAKAQQFRLMEVSRKKVSGESLIIYHTQPLGVSIA